MATVHLSPVGNGFQFLSANVIPALALGKIYTYGAGTTTPQDTYTTLAGSVKNANPILLNSDGRPPQEIWLVEGFAYRFDLYDANNNLIQTLDNLYGINDLSTNTSPIPTASVTFIQAGTGAVSRTMQDKAREIFSVKDFGMLPTASAATNVAGFNAATAAIKATGVRGLLVIPPGTYAMNANVIVDVGFISILGMGAKLDFSTLSAGIHAITVVNTNSNLGDNIRAVLEGFWLFGPGSGSTSRGFDFTSTGGSNTDQQLLDVRDVHVTDFQYGGYLFTNSYLLSTYHCSFRNCSTGFYVPTGGTNYGGDLRFSNTTFYQSTIGFSGFYSGTDAFFSDCAFDSNSSIDVQMNEGIYQFSNCHFETSTLGTPKAFYVAAGNPTTVFITTTNCVFIQHASSGATPYMDMAGLFMLNMFGGIVSANVGTNPVIKVSIGGVFQEVGVHENYSGPNFVTFVGSARYFRTPAVGNMSFSQDINIAGQLVVGSSVMISSTTSFTNGAGGFTGTLTNAPAATNPTKWIPVNDNGVTRYIPAW